MIAICRTCNTTFDVENEVVKFIFEQVSANSGCKKCNGNPNYLAETLSEEFEQ